ncbi:DNA-binding transcriptional regulator, CsgD family [Sphingopyxis sp. YR583]|uniref:LuxR C-terminal-related transcriptional regulator n=1 Tax=Sphingopyxis sp. YR583 TaxID=1881047 RepID=UPI0008A80796|nr:LuxR C-terminal-related transcriptional regulator [Sphingopyxis sp. YR583]SEH12524.1 DNA-binding transcriptional regulator, CsgD family [Sphingopyxis sp. YR583]
MTRNRGRHGEFAFITAKQAEVLDLLAQNRTSKEMAHALGLSETAVNRRIDKLRERLGGVTRAELGRRYRDWCDERMPATSGNPLKSRATGGGENRPQILQLSADPIDAPEERRDVAGDPTAFEDPVAITVEPPWKDWKEPRIVPRVLDGENATLARGAAIAILLVAIIASLVLALAAAKALADAVS